MSKRYSLKEDKFIVSYFDVVGDMIGPHDLGRSRDAVKRRAKFLKESGLWRALEFSMNLETKLHERNGSIPKDCVGALEASVNLNQIEIRWLEKWLNV